MHDSDWAKCSAGSIISNAEKDTLDINFWAQ